MAINDDPMATKTFMEGEGDECFDDETVPPNQVRNYLRRKKPKDKHSTEYDYGGRYEDRYRDDDYYEKRNGLWYSFGRPIILRSWKPGMEMLNVQITSLLIWVKFLNILLEYWTVTSLGYTASAVGIPLLLDTLTENHSRLSFARICFEVDVNCAFPKSALLNLGNGKYSTIRSLLEILFQGGSPRGAFILLFVSDCYGSLLEILFQGGSPS